ncbi:MAG: cell wall-binding protein [Methylobacter sp.]|nr:cell wall-binding protein [Methylobacter sp.]
MKSKAIEELLSDPTPATIDAVDPAIPIDKWSDRREGDFYIHDGRVGFIRKNTDRKTGKSNEIMTPLTHNFVSLIDQQLILDDGLRQEVAFEIATKQRWRGELPTVNIPATQYQAMAWPLRHYGGRAIIESDQASARKLATAILILSGDIPITVIYQHSGWRIIDGHYRYLSGSGALSAAGLDDKIRVELGDGHMQKFSLPPPDQNPGDKAQLLFGLLHLAPKNPALGVALFCGVTRAVLGECLPIDFSIYLAGQSGSQKSEAAALAQACFGEFDARSLPGNFNDTETVGEIKLHRAKDGVFVIDDRAPAANQAEESRQQAKSDRWFRGVGNQAGRGRCNADMTVKAAYFPRCMIVSTGEDLPKGASLLGRMLVIETKRGDVNLSSLTALQLLSRRGEHAAAMSNFITWLAPRLVDLKKRFPDLVRDLRDQALNDPDKFASSHPRAADIYASCYAAADIYMEYCCDVNGISVIHATELMETIDAGLKSAIRAQHQYQKANDEVERFVALLRGSFASGECHICSHLNQGPPVSNPHLWGWRAAEVGGEKIGRGQMIGWINEVKGEIWLEPEALFKTVQKFASSQNDPILMNKSTLWKRLLERGLLAELEIDKNGVKRPDIKRSVDGGRKRVLSFHTELITQTDKEAAKPEPRREYVND